MLRTVERELADAIAALQGFETTPVLIEDKGDISAELAEAIGKTSLAVVVGFGGFTDESPDFPTPLGTLNLRVTLFETPETNRALAGRPTLSVAAEAIASGLKLLPTTPGRLVLERIESPQELGEGVISAAVTFLIRNAKL